MRFENFINKVPWHICCRCGRVFKNGDRWKYICLSCRKELKLHTKPQEDWYLVWYVIRKYGRKSFGERRRTMSYQDCIALIDSYIEEPNNINQEWVECLIVCRRLLQNEVEYEKRLKEYEIRKTVGSNEKVY